MWRKTNPGRLLSTSCYKGWQDLAGGHAALKLIRSVPICMHICPFRDWSVSETFFLGTRTQYVSTSLYISLQDENLKRWMMVSWDSNESRFCLETVWDSEWGQYSKIASPLWSASSLTYSKTSVPWKPAFERFWNYIYIQVSGFFEHSKNIQSQTLQSVNDLFGVHSRAHAHHTKTLKFDPIIFSPFILWRTHT